MAPSFDPRLSPFSREATGGDFLGEASPEERRSAAVGEAHKTPPPAKTYVPPDKTTTPPGLKERSKSWSPGSHGRGGGGTIGKLALCAAPLFAGQISNSPEKYEKVSVSPDTPSSTGGGVYWRPVNQAAAFDTPGPSETSGGEGSDGGEAAATDDDTLAGGGRGRSLRDRHAPGADGNQGSGGGQDVGSCDGEVKHEGRGATRSSTTWGVGQAGTGSGSASGDTVGAVAGPGSNLPPSSLRLPKSGILYKKSEDLPGWRPRMFVIDEKQKLLRYYLASSASPRGSIPLEGCHVSAGTSAAEDDGGELGRFDTIGVMGFD